jgi:hypothetical protein
MLSTIDNPYSPFDEFDSWLAFDTRQGYNSISLLGRIAQTSNELSDADEALAIEQAIDEIVAENVRGVFIKVCEDRPIRHAKVQTD